MGTFEQRGPSVRQHVPLRNGEAHRRRRARVPALVAQPETISHLELSVRQHGGTESVFLVSLREFAGGVGAQCQDLHATLVEFWPEFFPSPQLGATIGSPVCAKELDEHRMASQTLRVEDLSVLRDVLVHATTLR